MEEGKHHQDEEEESLKQVIIKRAITEPLPTISSREGPHDILLHNN